MEGENAPELSQEGDGEPRARSGRSLGALRIPRPKLKVPKLRFKAPSLHVPRMAAPRLRLPAFPKLKIRRRASAPAAGRASADASPTGRLARFRPSAFAAGVCVVVAAVAFMAAMTFYGAQTFSRRAANTRASNEASSLARHSGTLATGGAFDGYIQILRFADDPVVHSKTAAHDARVAALQQLLFLNVNKFASLTIADRAGTVLATTDPSIGTVSGSATFAETRANLSPANSDVILPEPGKPGYVEYTAALKDADGTTWAILIGRADPARIWKGALDASVDGSRNVIINSDGLFATGVPDELLGQPWRGSAVGDGGVRANIAGVDAICGLAPIGKDTQIDRGLNVASCLPTSVIQAEHGAAMGKQGLITVAGAVLAIVLAGGALLLFGRTPSPAGAAEESGDAEAQPAIAEASVVVRLLEASDDALEDETAADEEKTDDEAAPPEPDVVVEAEAAPARAIEVAPPPPLAVDALTLIEAYEQRNARLSERLRESVQARLLVAATQADEAYKLAKSASPEEAEIIEAADKLHQHVMLELERLRELDLRAIGQELHPGLIRLGLPGALRSLRKELDGAIEVTLDVDPTADSVGRSAGRAAIPPGQRLTLYRFAAEATRALAGAGAGACTVSLRRGGDFLVLGVSSTTSETAEGHVDRSTFAASALAAEAYGGYLSVRRQDDRVTVSMEMPAQPVTEMPPVDLADYEDVDEEDDAAAEDVEVGTDDEADDAASEADSADDDDGGTVNGEQAPERAHAAADAPEIDIAAALERLRDESGDAPSVALEVDMPAGAEAIGLPQRKTAYELARVSVDALRASGAQRCSVSLKHGSDLLMISILSETDGTPFDAAPIKPVEAAIEALGGYVAVSRRDNAVSVTAEIMAPPQAAGDGEPSDAALPSENAA